MTTPGGMSRASKRRKGAARTWTSTAPYHLPDEIMNEILLLLPARSVIRFRAVCRLWAARLSSSGFADAYAAKSTQARRTATKFVVFAPFAATSSSPPLRLSYCSTTAAYTCTRDSAVADQLFTVDHLRADYIRSMSGRPCHGLLLFSEAARSASGIYWVCNPSTGECRRLPRPHRGLTESSAGLVYDNRTNECKVVHVFFKEFGACNLGLGCEVYTLSDDPSRRRWREATGGIELMGTDMVMVLKALRAEATVTKVPPVFADGHLHWLLHPTNKGNPQQLGEDAILCFSVADETFTFVSAPASVPMEDYTRLEEHSDPAAPIHLAELGGSLSMVHDLRSGHPDQQQGRRSWLLDVWVLRDRDTSEWSLEYRIALSPLIASDVRSPRFITILGLCSSDDGTRKKERNKVLVATSHHKVYAYDPGVGEVETVFSVSDTDIGFQREAAAGLRLGLYEDSLTIVGGGISIQESAALSVVTQILLRLPVKSIARSMLVCRQWCTLIESESFASSMMNKKRPKRVLMVNNGRGRCVFFEFAPLGSLSGGCWQQLQVVADTLLDDTILCSKPCHGLNLISTSSDDYVCNPCTGAIRCLSVRGRSHFSPSYNNNLRQPSIRPRHAFTVSRNVGFGYDRRTGEHVVVEIGHDDLSGTLACMVKTSRTNAWIGIGSKPPAPVSDMPPAHVNGTLYWMGERTRQQEKRVLVSFDISRRTFDILPCGPASLKNRGGGGDVDDGGDGGLFLVELNDTLSLVVANAEAEEMEVWMMHKPGATWALAHKMCLRGYPDFSPKTDVVVPLEISSEDGRILLNTGRALGYYDTNTGAIHVLYSLASHSQLNQRLVFPMLCEDSLVRIHDDDDDDDELIGHEEAVRFGCGDQKIIDDDTGEAQVLMRSIFHKCANIGCQGRNADVYSMCCRRVICRECVQRRCLEHSYQLHVRLPASYSSVVMGIRSIRLPLHHPFVPGPDYCYYYSNRDDDDVGRHVFVLLKDLVRNNQPCRLVECVYRMDGHVVKETWARRYIEDDTGRR